MSEAEQVTHDGAAQAAPPTGVLAELGGLGRAIKELFGAQLELLSAEIGLARASLSRMVLAGLAATAAGAGLALTVLALAAVLLASWFGSWIWALVALALLQLLFVLGAALAFRRCLHSMSLPVTRAEWGAMMRETRARARRQVEREDAP